MDSKKLTTNRFANRTRILYFIVPAIMAAIILVIGFVISRNIADDAAHRMARQYSIEAASNFQVHMNPHMRLMQQMSYSVAIARWLANEYDEAAKAAAFEEMMGHAITWPDAYYMFTVYETLHGYDFGVDLTLDTFTSWGRLSGGEASQWFFDTRDAEAPYILNIQRTRPDEYGNWDLYIWSNHRVYYQERFVGVFTMGAPFASIYGATFGGFDDEGKRGYIIDRFGMVRLDSAGILETTADGLPALPPVPEASDNPALEYGINSHLQMLSGGMFPLGMYTTTAIRLDSGEFRYASISAIIGTDWSVMVLSSLDQGFAGQYTPLILITITLFVLYAFFGNILLSASQRKERQANERAMAEVQRVEIERESNRAKDRFLARMSHEIRTPISAVLGISEIQLRTPSLPRNMEESFVKIHDSAQTLLSIVNDILDFSKIESGKMSITNKAYEIASLINDAAQIHMVYVDHKNIIFQMSLNENLPARLIGDPLRIRQIINNLVSNAFKYTEDGHVTLSLNYEKQQNDQITLLISIEDTGFGMTPQQLETLKISEYSRFHEEEKSAASGTGLGVPIVYSLVQMMNGQIEFTSTPGKGTTVVVRIPQQLCGTEILGKDIADSLQNFKTNTWKSTKAAKFVPEPMPYGKVLVVDDIDANLFVAQGLLDFYGLSVETCKSGQAAINKVKQGNVYDVIFMDNLMPDLSGIETIRIMRDMGYTSPVVALTANALVGQAEEFIKNGFDDFVSKPIQTLQLNEVLIKFIRDKQPPEVIAKAKLITSENDINGFLERDDISQKLRADFAKNHKNAFSLISEALSTGDIKTAHRLSHTLKSLASLIHEDALLQAAENIEALLTEGKMPESHQLSTLENELNQVLEGIDIPTAPILLNSKSNDEILAMLDQLSPLILTNRVDSLGLIDELREVPEAAILIKQIEDFDFKSAAKSIETLKTLFEV